MYTDFASRNAGFTPPDAAECVSRLLDSAADRARFAQQSLCGNDLATADAAIASAIGIVDALSQSLDTQRGGDIATRLEYLYGYSALRLHEGGRHRDPLPLEEAAQLLDVIAGAWREMRRGGPGTHAAAA